MQRTAVHVDADAVGEHEIHFDEAREAAEYFLRKRVGNPADGLPTESYFAAYDHMRSMSKYSSRTARRLAANSRTDAAAAWEPLGPGNVGGRVRAIALFPNNPQRLLAAGVSGGVWVSSDGGASWSPKGDKLVNLVISTITIDPVSPNIVYAGTGEYSTNSRGAGIFKSVDAGETWTSLGATRRPEFDYSNRIAVSRVTPGRVLAGNGDSLWRSDDFGSSWIPALGGTRTPNGEVIHACDDVVRSDTGTGEYYLATCMVLNETAHSLDRWILRSNDAVTWQAIVGEPDASRAVVAARGARAYVLFASHDDGPDFNGDGFGDFAGGLRAVLRSDDAGLTWRSTVRNSDAHVGNRLILTDPFVICFPGIQHIQQGSYDLAIAIDPADSDRVWVGGTDFYRSDDGGFNWNAAGGYFGGVHADQHLMVFPYDYDGVTVKHAYVGNDGGVFRLEDARSALTPMPATFVSIETFLGNATPPGKFVSLNHGLAITQFYHGAVYPGGQRYLGGTQDNGVISGDEYLGSEAWRNVACGDGTVSAVDPVHPQNVYTSCQSNEILRSTSFGEPGTFVLATAGIDPVDRAQFIAPLIIDPNQSRRLWTGRHRVYRSDDSAQSWRPASVYLTDELDSSAFISAIGVANGNSDRVAIGAQGSVSYVFVNDQATTADENTPWIRRSQRFGYVSSIQFARDDPNRLYVTDSRFSSFLPSHVWTSTDFGQTFTPLSGAGSGALPNVGVNTLAIDPRDPQHLFVGTDVGIFTSINRGQSWMIETSGFPNTLVDWLEVDNSTPRPKLFAFTYGRGAWRLSLATANDPPDYRINRDVNGMWFDPAQSGQGFVFEILDINGAPNVFASWYTYLNGEQRWLFGVGPVDGNRAHLRLSVASSGDFPPDFSPATAVTQDWGDLNLSFDSSHVGHAQWTSSFPGYGDGGMDLIPLTQVLRPIDDPQTEAVSACVSGNWYNIQQSGHGLEMQVIAGPNNTRQLLVTWYVYDRGKPMFLVGNGPIEGTHATVVLARTHGAQFPPAFRASDVVREVWGAATITFTGQYDIPDFTHATLDWTPQVSGFNPGSLALTRLTTLIGHECR